MVSEHIAGIGRLCFRRLGSGPDLVLLHGLLGSGGQWRASAEGLAEGFTCWILELPGISASEARSDLSLPGLREWLEQAVNGLGLRRFSLIGSSWGGAVGLEFAATLAVKSRLRRLVVVAPTHPYWMPSRRQRRLLTPPWTRLAAWLGARLPLRAQRGLLARMYGDRSRLAVASVVDYRTVLRQPGLGAAVAAYARDWKGDQRRLRTMLSAVQVPTLLVWGGRDRVVPGNTVPALQEAMPHAELAVLAGLGHLPFEEDPGAFNRAIYPFLTLSGADPEWE